MRLILKLVVQCWKVTLNKGIVLMEEESQHLGKCHINCWLSLCFSRCTLLSHLCGLRTWFSNIKTRAWIGGLASVLGLCCGSPTGLRTVQKATD